MLTVKAAGAILLAIIVCAALPAMFIVNGQTNQRTEEKMVTLAEQAANDIQTLITSTFANESACARIENVSLTEQFQGNVTLFQTNGLGMLNTAKEALANSNYNLASESALDALTLYRQVYSSLEIILSTAGLQDSSNLTSQGLSDAITRELQRTETLQTLLPAGTSQDTLTLVNTANSNLLDAKVALQANRIDEAEQRYIQAKQNITKLYQYLKTQAEESNNWRLNQYCETLQQRIQELFTCGNNNGVDFASALASLGYQSQNAFMQALQSKIQSAQSKGNIQDAINECLSLNQLVQQTEQVLNQEINRQQQGQQAQPSPSSNGAGGSSSAGPTTNVNGSSSGSNGSTGSGGYSGSGNGVGGNK